MIKINGKVAKSTLHASNKTSNKKIQEKLQNDDSLLRLGNVIDFKVDTGGVDALEGLIFHIFDFLDEAQSEKILAKIEEEILEND